MHRIEILTAPCDLSDALLVRDLVFTKEQGFRSPDSDEYDAVSSHVVIFDGDRPIATGRVYCDHDNVYKLGRIAVLKEYRGQDLGRVLMQELETIAVSLGAEQLTLGAQLYAVPFYQKCGFAPTGDRYMDEFCEHEHLTKNIK